eukprot:366338-Chlamydomonas_euryale.AAC.11
MPRSADCNTRQNAIPRTAECDTADGRPRYTGLMTRTAECSTNGLTRTAECSASSLRTTRAEAALGPLPERRTLAARHNATSHA